MKAYHNYTTAMKTAIRLRWGTTTLLILAALIVVLMLRLSTNGRSTIPASPSASFVHHAAEPIASCRACRDEWVAAQRVQSMPAVIAAPASTILRQPAVVRTSPVFRAAEPIASCRACRDEWITAHENQMPTSTFISGASYDQPDLYAGRSGPK
jgi:hypothetical protein